MVMPQVAFDTLEFVKELEEAGLEPKIAAAQAKAQVKILSELVERQIATKSDIKDVKSEIKDLKAEIKDVKSELQAEIKDVRSEIKDFKADIEIKIDRIDSKIDSVEQRLVSRMDTYDGKLDFLEQRLTMKVGKIMVAGVGFIAALLTVFHFL